ncbi:hypothetical protein BKI52_43800 [marine bacterium AO1-C]|nr:hypothetical protein BKI52_43800 [marine bacterium AO1-C]
MKNHLLTMMWVASLVTVTHFLQAQSIPVVELPRQSQRAIVGQTIGITDITIRYHRPAIRGRKLHQRNIAPLGKLWRAGANENTVIEFTHAVKVEGKPLAAGKYGLHMIPNKEKWVLVFSKNHRSWGSYYYKKEEDALRVEVKPAQGTSQEWLTYAFSEVAKNSTVVTMRWATTQISFKVVVDVKQVVVENLRNEMRGLSGYYWQGPYLAARFCNNNNCNLEEAIQWADRSIGIKQTFQNLLVKSQLLQKTDKAKDSKQFKEKAFKIATEQDLIQYGYNLGQEVTNKERNDHFAYIVKRFNSWTAYQAQGIVFRYFGEKENAVKSFENALKRAPENQKARLEKAISNLKKN